MCQIKVLMIIIIIINNHFIVCFINYLLIHDAIYNKVVKCKTITETRDIIVLKCI